MRTQVIPAQITTVEDKIAGNLNITQLLILISPALVVAFVYVLLPPTMKFVGYKLGISLIAFIAAVFLSLRIKGKVVVNWLGLLLAYNQRPKYYVYNKNEPYLRKMDIVQEKKLDNRKQIAIKEVRNGVLALPNNQYRSIIETSSVNFELKSETEQDVMIDSFVNFLNSLPCNLQILVRVREVDIDDYLKKIAESKNSEKQ